MIWKQNMYYKIVFLMLLWFMLENEENIDSNIQIEEFNLKTIKLSYIICYLYCNFMMSYLYVYW